MHKSAWIRLPVLSLICLLSLLLSCGYHFEGDLKDRAVSVPYVKGDVEGNLTAEIIRAISSSGQFRFARDDGDLILHVDVISDVNEKIDYRYGRNKIEGRSTDHLFPTANRRTLTAEVTLTSCVTDEAICGPFTVFASTDLDYVDVGSVQDLEFYNNEGRRKIVLDFSQGQLDSVEGAQDDSLTPLYRRLAQKIVDLIIAFQ